MWSVIRNGQHFISYHPQGKTGCSWPHWCWASGPTRTAKTSGPVTSSTVRSPPQLKVKVQVEKSSLQLYQNLWCSYVFQASINIWLGEQKKCWVYAAEVCIRRNKNLTVLCSGPLGLVNLCFHTSITLLSTAVHLTMLQQMQKSWLLTSTVVNADSGKLHNSEYWACWFWNVQKRLAIWKGRGVYESQCL